MKERIMQAKFVFCLAIYSVLSTLVMGHEYEIVDLGRVDARGLNEYGDVVGRAGTTAFFWNWETGIIDLGAPKGANWSEAVAVNTGYQVAGNSAIGAFVFDFGSGFYLIEQDLPVQYHTPFIRGMNNSGQSVGHMSRSDVARAVAFLREPNGTIINLGNLPGALAGRAYAISDAGFVVGDSGSRPFIWSRPTGMRELSGSGGRNPAVTTVNNNGEAAGNIFQNQWVAAMWTSDREILILGGLPDALITEAKGINDFQQVVGLSAGAKSGNRAFLWDPQNGMRDLNDLIPKDSGWTLQQAKAISNGGYIVGAGQEPGGQNHAFLLVPSF